MGKLTSGKKQKKGSQNWSIGIDVLCIFTYTLLNYRFTRTFTDHSSVITRCWGFELQNGKRASKAERKQTLAAQSFAPASFWSTFDLRCKSPACGDFYRKAEGNPQRFPPQTPPSSRRTKDSAFVRRKELAADTYARSAFQSEVRQGFCVERINSIPRAWI